MSLYTISVLIGLEKELLPHAVTNPLKYTNEDHKDGSSKASLRSKALQYGKLSGPDPSSA